MNRIKVLGSTYLKHWACTQTQASVNAASSCSVLPRFMLGLVLLEHSFKSRSPNNKLLISFHRDFLFFQIQINYKNISLFIKTGNDIFPTAGCYCSLLVSLWTLWMFVNKQLCPSNSQKSFDLHKPDFESKELHAGVWSCCNACDATLSCARCLLCAPGTWMQ